MPINFSTMSHAVVGVVVVLVVGAAVVVMVVAFVVVCRDSRDRVGTG